MSRQFVGDTGPRRKFGEGSRALLRELRGNSSATIEEDEPVTTILLPGTAGIVLAKWPIDPESLVKVGAAVISKLGGQKAIKGCPSFETLN